MNNNVMLFYTLDLVAALKVQSVFFAAASSQAYHKSQPVNVSHCRVVRPQATGANLATLI